MPAGRRHQALPERLAGFLVEGRDGRLLAAGGDDDAIAVDQRRFTVAPLGHRAAEVGGQALVPDDLAIGHLEAGDRAAEALDIEQIAVDGRRAGRPLNPLRRALLEGRSEPRGPKLLAILLRKRQTTSSPPRWPMPKTFPAAIDGPL